MACDWRRCGGLNLGNDRLKMANICGFPTGHEDRTQLSSRLFGRRIAQAIVAYLDKGMPPREIIDQLIARGFVRDPGNNALEDVVQGLADMAEQMRRDRATLIGQLR